MDDKNWEQKFVENHPVCWSTIRRLVEFFIFILKVDIALIILKLIGHI